MIDAQKRVDELIILEKLRQSKRGGFIGGFLTFCGVIFLIIVAGCAVAYFVLRAKGLL